MASGKTTRVAIVTGAAQGIGRAIAVRLASDGLDVVVDDLPYKIDKLNEVVKEIEGKGRRGLAITVDVAHEEEVQAMVNKTVEVFGRLDVMIANAGITLQNPVDIMKGEISDWDTIHAVNTRGVILCYKYAAIQMAKQGYGGRILGASSICGYKGYSNVGSYCVSKASVRLLTQSAALELDKHGITVNAYAPGLIETDLTRSDKDDELGGPGAGVKLLLGMALESKIGQPRDVASLVSYLVSSEAHFITGQTIAVEGGTVHFN